jgi:hypothetical protein
MAHAVKWSNNWFLIFAIGVESGSVHFKTDGSASHGILSHVLTCLYQPLSQLLEMLTGYFRQTWDGPYERAPSGVLTEENLSEFDPTNEEPFNYAFDVEFTFQCMLNRPPPHLHSITYFYYEETGEAVRRHWLYCRVNKVPEIVTG